MSDTGKVEVGEIIGGRFQVTEPGLIATTGPEDCTDPRCSRIGLPDGSTRCVGNHCANCGEPSSMLGHFTHIAWWTRTPPGTLGEPVMFPDGAGYFSCSGEYAEAVARLREEDHDGAA